MTDRKYICIIKIKRREPEHDGYCSDAGEDEGEEKIFNKQIKVSPELLKKLKETKSINKIGKGDVDIARINNIKEITQFERGDNVFCCQGSGYCGYTGYEYIESFQIFNSIKR